MFSLGLSAPAGKSQIVWCRCSPRRPPPPAAVPLAALALAALPPAALPLAALPPAALPLAAVPPAALPPAAVPLAALPLAVLPLAALPLAVRAALYGAAGPAGAPAGGKGSLVRRRRARQV
jgi:MYXO-CTERM domain-containing protein